MTEPPTSKVMSAACKMCCDASVSTALHLHEIQVTLSVIT
jgi:hypothetical protein